MYIIQMADLHIGSQEEASLPEHKIVRESIKEIRGNVPEGEKLLFCVCGDLVDSSNMEGFSKDQIKKRYKSAAELLQIYKADLEKDYDFNIKFCMGNHDVTHSAEFFDCVKELDADIQLEDLMGTYCFKAENVYYIFVNSCFGEQYKKGQINYEGLLNVLNMIPDDAKKILVLHHTIMSMDEQDESSIRNAAKLVGILDKYNFIGVLHGHIHGRDILEIGKNPCKIIGTGALFSRNNADVNSQFNIIRCQNGIISDILNCRFMADGGNDGHPWDALHIGGINCENYFMGNSFQSVYEELLDKLEVMMPLYNLVLHISCSYEAFAKDLDSYLRDDVLKIGKKSFKYIDLAKMWEALEVPKELYFNHGQYFKVNGEHGIEFIAEQLKDKPTSNRNVLSTYSMDTIVHSFKEQQYLPSLSSIQFSMDQEGEELYVHMHLRALEASRFLKINICEIAYLLQELKKRNIKFDKVSVVISAFRVQKSEKFNCFIKSGIDEMSPVTMGVKVNNGNIDEICGLLEEKKDATETITEIDGIKNLADAMKASNIEKSGDSHKIYYPSEIIGLLDNLLTTYKRLDAQQKNSSIRNKEEKGYQEEIERLLCNLVIKLKELKAEEGRAE